MDKDICLFCLVWTSSWAGFRILGCGPSFLHDGISPLVLASWHLCEKGARPSFFPLLSAFSFCTHKWAHLNSRFDLTWKSLWKPRALDPPLLPPPAESPLKEASSMIHSANIPLLFSPWVCLLCCPFETWDHSVALHFAGTQ